MRVEFCDQERLLFQSETVRIGEIRIYQHGFKFKVAVGFFHVLSYLTQNRDLAAAFRDIFLQLDSGASSSQTLGFVRLSKHKGKRLEDEFREAFRIADPLWMKEENRVDVEFTVFGGE